MSDLARKLAEAVWEWLEPNQDNDPTDLAAVLLRAGLAELEREMAALEEIHAAVARRGAHSTGLGACALDAVLELKQRLAAAERRLEHIAELHEGLDWCDECECFQPCPTRWIATEGSEGKVNAKQGALEAALATVDDLARERDQARAQYDDLMALKDQADDQRDDLQRQLAEAREENVKLRNWINRVCDVVREDEAWRSVDAATRAAARQEPSDDE